MVKVLSYDSLINLIKTFNDEDAYFKVVIQITPMYSRIRTLDDKKPIGSKLGVLVLSSIGVFCYFEEAKGVDDQINIRYNEVKSIAPVIPGKFKVDKDNQVLLS